jgi:hypothetical protein
MTRPWHAPDRTAARKAVVRRSGVVYDSVPDLSGDNV